MDQDSPPPPPPPSLPPPQAARPPSPAIFIPEPAGGPVPTVAAAATGANVADGHGSATDVDRVGHASTTAVDLGGPAGPADPADPLSLARLRHRNATQRQMKIDHPNGNKRALKDFYTRQNELIDRYLGADDEERAGAEEDRRVGPSIRFAVNASFTVNFCLFIIQLYAAIATGSLSLFATAADAFMDLVSSFVMLITSRLAARASVYKYPVGRTRIETIGIILFCALMTTVAIQLLVESGRTLGAGARPAEPLRLIPIIFVGVAILAKTSLMLYCLAYRRYPTVNVFFVDHRNDIVVNVFGLVMSIVGGKFVWYLDPLGAICIALLILFSWIGNAFEQVWLLVGKSAPRDFISKLIYMSMTHDDQILKVDTCRAYHAGQRYYVEVDIIMDREVPLRISHDVSQNLQRKLEGLRDVERAFVHVDYDDDHNIYEEHKPLYEPRKKRRTLREVLLGVKEEEGQGETRDGRGPADNVSSSVP